ncbi:recombinase RecA [Pasteurellaceae bacterium USgator11]|nr:recombinase RecA [Pasteurellaceae bacterium UScroc12]TNG95698.1 recombinase RecA [Pasteurellaceae bacterium USgator41]TNG96756.1 recombinase RecA [Pasteurellaceae bacterium UScroc31]TNG99129.1 recombinase RecA [Pasteurellaceae bacterium USgator11]
MKKIFLAVGVSLFAVGAQAADLSESCTKYFEQIDQFVAKSGQNPAMASMKDQLEASKTQLASLPKEVQEQSCAQGIDALKQMEAALPK